MTEEIEEEERERETILRTRRAEKHVLSGAYCRKNVCTTARQHTYGRVRTKEASRTTLVPSWSRVLRDPRIGNDLTCVGGRV